MPTMSRKRGHGRSSGKRVAEVDLKSAPIYSDPRADAIIENLAVVVRLLREFPDHIQAPEWRVEIAVARKESPELLAMAELIVAKENEVRDALREHPENCSRCHGTGYYRWARANHGGFCSCPVGEALERNRTLARDAFERGITQQEPAAEGQLALGLGAA